MQYVESPSDQKVKQEHAYSRDSYFCLRMYHDWQSERCWEGIPLCCIFDKFIWNFSLSRICCFYKGEIHELAERKKKKPQGNSMGGGWWSLHTPKTLHLYTLWSRRKSFLEALISFKECLWVPPTKRRKAWRGRAYCLPWILAAA